MTEQLNVSRIEKTARFGLPKTLSAQLLSLLAVSLLAAQMISAAVIFRAQKLQLDNALASEAAFKLGGALSELSRRGLIPGATVDPEENVSSFEGSVAARLAAGLDWDERFDSRLSPDQSEAEQTNPAIIKPMRPADRLFAGSLNQGAFDQGSYPGEQNMRRPRFRYLITSSQPASVPKFDTAQALTLKLLSDRGFPLSDLRLYYRSNPQSAADRSGFMELFDAQSSSSPLKGRTDNQSLVAAVRIGRGTNELLNRSDISSDLSPTRLARLPNNPGMSPENTAQPQQWVTVTLRLPKPTSSIALVLILQTLVLYLLVLLPLAWLIKRIAAPLDELTDSARHFVKTSKSTHVNPRGPSDVQRLSVAFNRMQQRIDTLLKEKDMMLGAIGHDLKTPLAALRVRSETLSSPAREPMIASIERIDQMLSDILSLARLGQGALTTQSVSLSALLELIVSEYEDLQKPVTLINPPRVTAQLQVSWITRAITNLIDNALRYGHSAEVRLIAASAEASSEAAHKTTDKPLAQSSKFSSKTGADTKNPSTQTTQDSAAWIIQIDDQGPGIDPVLIPRLLEPFERLEGSRSSSLGGAGLGLTLTQAICDQHGLSLKLTNRLGSKAEVVGLRAQIISTRSSPADCGKIT